MATLKLPSIKSPTPSSPPTPLPVQDEIIPLNDNDRVKSMPVPRPNTTTLFTPAEQAQLSLAAPPRKKQGKDAIRKPPPHPDTLMGKAYLCLNKYRTKYLELVQQFDQQFTQLTREDLAEKRRLAALQVTPPSTVASPRIEATLEDVIDLCKSQVKAGKLKRLRKLIRDNMIDINQCSEVYGGWTPAIACARTGSTKTLSVLVDEFNADVNLTEIHNWTPLMFAAYRGHVKTVRYLVTVANADRTVRCNGRQWNAQMYARSKAFPTSHSKKRAAHRQKRNKRRGKQDLTPDQLNHQEIISILKGDTPYHTPRVLDYDAELNFRSLLFAQRRNLKIEQAKISAVNCWCMNLEIRCKKCQYKVNNKTNAQEDEERAAFLKREAEREVERRALDNMAPVKNWDDLSSDSSEEEEEEEEEEGGEEGW